MPTKAFKEDGSEIEVPTEEEKEQKEKEIRDQGRKDAESDYGTEKNEMQEEIDGLNEDLQKAQDKDQNFSKMREKTDKQEKEKEENKGTIEGLQKQIDEKNAEITNFVVGGTKTDIADELSEGDPDLKEAILVNMDRIEGSEDTKEDIVQKAREALAMSIEQAGVDEEEDAAAEADSAGSGGRSVGDGGSPKITQDAKDMGKNNFGLTDEDFSKHGPK